MRSILSGTEKFVTVFVISFIGMAWEMAIIIGITGFAMSHFGAFAGLAVVLFTILTLIVYLTNVAPLVCNATIAAMSWIYQWREKNGFL